MAVAFRSASSGDSGAASTNTASITKPSGTASGDVLVAIGECDSLSDGSGALTSSGWTSIFQSAFTLDGAQVGVIYKVAGGSEPSSYTFTSSTTVGQGSLGVIIGCYSGCDTTTPIHKSGRTATDSDGGNPFTISAPSITPTIDGCMIVWLGAADKTGQINVTFAVPGGYNSRSTLNAWSTNPWSSLALADSLQTTAAATGAQTANWSGVSAAPFGVHLALAPPVTSSYISKGNVLRPYPFSVSNR